MTTVVSVGDQAGDPDAAQASQSEEQVSEEQVSARDDESVPSQPPAKKKSSKFRIARRTVSLLATVAIVFLVWPAAWGGLFTFAIVSGVSMEPTYHTGDVVVAMKSFSGYQVGDAIVYTVDQDGITGKVVHRIVTQLPDGNYLTQGDNKPSPDPWEVQPSWINGKVLSMLPQGAKALLIIRSPIFLAVLCGLLITAALWPRNGAEADEEPDVEALVEEDLRNAETTESSEDRPT